MKTKGEEKRGGMLTGEHVLLSSMTKGEIVDEIVIDANMDLQWPQGVIDATKSHLQCLNPLQSGFGALKHLYLEAPCTLLTRSCATRLDLEATTLLKDAKTYRRCLKTQEMVLSLMDEGRS